MSGNPAIV